ncbi:MAG: outer membrane beta-barrel protein [Magnetococcales bacterium]|nr:outer membrane beta-barrel protein [Magnetococcales bacterium]
MKCSLSKLTLAAALAWMVSLPTAVEAQPFMEPVPPMEPAAGQVDSIGPNEPPPPHDAGPPPGMGRFYAGAGAGRVLYAEMNPTAADLDSRMANAGIAGSAAHDTDDVGFKAFAGYRAERYWGFFDRQAVEVAYVDLGQLNANVKITSPVAVSTQLTNEIRGVSLTWNGGRTLSPQMMVFAKAGAYYWEQKSSFAVSGTSGSVNLTGTDEGFSPILGIGAEYFMTPDMGLRGEWEYFSEVGDPNNLGSTDAHLFSVSGIVNF